MAEPYDTFRTIHNTLYDKLKTDTRLTGDYRLSSWDQGIFDMQKLPTTGTHARYERKRATMGGACANGQSWILDVNIWVLITQGDADTLYDMAERYLDNITQCLTQEPTDWSINGTVDDIRPIIMEYSLNWNERRKTMLLALLTLSILVTVTSCP